MRGASRGRRVAHAVRQRTLSAWETVEVERHGERNVPLAHENFRYRHFLLPTYLDYVSVVSWADHAVSLQTAAVLLQVCEERRPKRVLDTGSGYSSYVLRRYAQEHGAEVVSVDDDPLWIEKTAGYLNAMEVGAAGLMTWADFQATSHEPFGLIFHDMGTHRTRVQSMSQISALIAHDGYLVYDDMQVEEVRVAARAITAAAGRRYFAMHAVTTDEIGRYAGLSVS